MIIGIDASRANLPERSGVERYAFEIIRRLPRLMPEAIFRLYVREKLTSEWGPLPKNVEVRVLGWPPRYMWSHLRLGWELAVNRPDLLFVPASALPVWVNCRSIITLHDVAFDRYPECYGWWERTYQRWIVRKARRQAERVLTVSEFTKQELVEIYGFDSGLVTATPVAARVVEASSSVSEEFLEGTYLLFVGRREMKKGIKNLMIAYRQYCEESTRPARLVLVGRAGKGWDEAEGEIPAGWVGERVLIKSWVSDRELDQLYRNALAYIALSCYEGFGLTPLEAAANGCAVIATDIPAHREVLGSNAEFVKVGDLAGTVKAMRLMSENEHLREDLARRAKARSGQFSFDQTAEATARVIRSTLERRVGK